MTFGEYIKRRRLELHLNQDEVPNFNQAYISKIESGKNPLKLATIEALAEALKIEDIDWLWAYALLDVDPYIRFGSKKSPEPSPIESLSSPKDPSETPVFKKANNSIRIEKGQTMEELVRLLGLPDEQIDTETQSKCFYKERGISVLFERDRVVKVTL